jgi:hypothetical protein
VKFLNWSKGLTVKEKILLHLLHYNQYSTSDDVPEQVTQQGIATVIFAPRPHVSIALKDLRAQNLITESSRHIKEGKRKQKVYFLNPSGVQFTSNINTRTRSSQISVRTVTDVRQQKFNDVLKEHNISIFDALNRIDDEGILDLTKKDDPFKEEPWIKPTLKPPSKTIKPEKPEKPGGNIAYQPQSTTAPAQSTTTAQSQNTGYYSQSDYQQHGYYPYYYPSQPPAELSEKVSLFLFTVGYFLFIMGGIVGVFLFTLYNPILIIPLVLFFTFGISCIAFSTTALWQSEIWQKRIINLFVITCPIVLYLLFYSAVSTEIALYDLGIWIIIIISFLLFAFFGSFIPIENRIQLLSILGIILMINSPLVYFMVDIEIYQVGFWLLIGLICIFISNILTTNTSETKGELLTDLYTGVLYGIGLGIIIASIIFSNNFESKTLDGIDYGIYITIGLWCLTAMVLIYQVFKNQNNQSEIINLTKSFRSGIPSLIGILLIFFGIYLISLEKAMESLVELFLGAILIINSLKQMKEQEQPLKGLVVILLIAICFCLTLAYSIII